MPYYTPYCMNDIASGEHPMCGVIYETTGEWFRSPEACEGRDRDAVAFAKPYGSEGPTIELPLNECYQVTIHDYRMID